MVLKILSGVIRPEGTHQGAGSATIDFSPHDVSGDIRPMLEHDFESHGPDDPFGSEPNVIVALKDLYYAHADDTGLISFPGGVESMGFSLDTKFTTPTKRQGLEVSWSTEALIEGQDDPQGRNTARIREISYLIIGDTEEDEYDEDREPVGEVERDEM
jgi:hypothetical protein